jgi:hypothetical protein
LRGTAIMSGLVKKWRFTPGPVVNLLLYSQTATSNGGLMANGKETTFRVCMTCVVFSFIFKIHWHLYNNVCTI